MFGLRGGISLFKILGIRISLDYSWFLIFFLVTFSFATGYFPGKFPHLSEVGALILGGLASVLFFASVLFHELSHSLMAKRLGITIEGITLFVFGGVARILDEPKRPVEEFLITIVGPVSSVFLASIFGLTAWGLRLFLVETAASVFSLLSTINFTLAVFNLLPGYPLDGGRILRSLVWAKTGSLRESTKVASRGGRLIATGMMIFGGILTFSGDFGTGLWLVFLGFFLDSAAQAGLEQVELSEVLKQVSVSELMDEVFVAVKDSTVLPELIQKLARTKKDCLPVFGKKGEFAGLVSIDSLKKVRGKRLEKLETGDILEKAQSNWKVLSSDSAFKAFKRLNSLGVSILPVYSPKENGLEKLIGFVGRKDIEHYLLLKMGLEGEEGWIS